LFEVPYTSGIRHGFSEGGKMKTIRLGATALEISEIGFGGIPVSDLRQSRRLEIMNRSKRYSEKIL
jgi:UDP-N-acetylglucosamine transferase subunit ALG13